MIIRSRYSNPDGSAIVVDIMRINDGVFEEPEASRERSKSGLPMFGGVFTK